MLIDGKAIAGEILKEVREVTDTIGRKPMIRAVTVCPTPATESYLKIKSVKAAEAGMQLAIVRLPEDATGEQVIAAVTEAGADAVIVQLPLPSHLDTQEVLDAIPLGQDADVLSSMAYERFHTDAPGALVPPVVGAIARIFERADVAVTGKRVVVVGNGKLVGRPAAWWLTVQGAREVTVLDEETFTENRSALTAADIIVSGAGSPHLIKPEMITPGAVCIDAGTSDLSGAIAGDFDPACADMTAVFTPVPGGVGPVAVAYLFKNVASLLTAHGLQSK